MLKFYVLKWVFPFTKDVRDEIELSFSKLEDVFIISKNKKNELEIIELEDAIKELILMQLSLCLRFFL